MKEKIIEINSLEKLKVIQKRDSGKFFLEYLYFFKNNIYKRIIEYSHLNTMELHFEKIPNTLTENIIKIFRKELIK